MEATVDQGLMKVNAYKGKHVYSTFDSPKTEYGPGCSFYGDNLVVIVTEEPTGLVVHPHVANLY